MKLNHIMIFTIGNTCILSTLLFSYHIGSANLSVEAIFSRVRNQGQAKREESRCAGDPPDSEINMKSLWLAPYNIHRLQRVH